MLRLPETMRDRITAAAKANNRSMNAEIVSRLERSFDASKMDADVEAAVLRGFERFLAGEPASTANEVRKAIANRRKSTRKRLPKES